MTQYEAASVVPAGPLVPNGARRGRPSTKRLIWRTAALVATFAVWQLMTTLLGRDIVPAPVDVARSLVALLQTPDFWGALWSTLSSTLGGLAIAVAISVPLGLLVGRSSFLAASSRLTVDFLRTIPAITLIPLVVLLYGPTVTMQVILIVFGSVWPLFVQAIYGVREIDPVLRDVAKIFHVSRRSQWANIILPSAAPFLVVGLRVASTIALLLAVGAELIGNAPGLGMQIALSQMDAQAATAYAYVVVAAIIGVAMNLLIGAGQKRVLYWHPSIRSSVASR
jgi:ABC-type nitrate/sulfonate/bicarbonate transport system permease component